MATLNPQLLSAILFSAFLPLLARAAEPPPPPPTPAQVFLRALGSAESTPEARREAWKQLLEAAKRPPRSAVDAVDRARERAWKRLADLLNSSSARRVAGGLYAAIKPQQPKVREAVGAEGFSHEKLDEAMAPIEKALKEAQAPLLASDAYKAATATIDEMEGYAADCGLRIGWNGELCEALCALAFVARWAGPPRWRDVLENNARFGGWIDPSECACIERLNVHRILIGLAPAEIDLRLVAAAKKHSEEMVAKDYFSHDSPTPDLKTPWARAGREHTGSSGECIAAGPGSGVGAFQMWFYSQGHHKIMISGASAVGVGRCQNKWTLMMGGSRMSGALAGKMAQYVRRRYEAGESIEKLLDLAKWASDNKLVTQAQDELERVLLLDPKNEQAKKALDRIRSKSR